MHHRTMELDNNQAGIYGGLSFPLAYNLMNQKDPPVAELMASLSAQEFMIDDRIEEIKQLEVLSQTFRFDRRRLELWVCPTTRCEQNCPGCPHEKNRTDLAASGWERLLEIISGRAQGLKKLTVCWWGGEPFLNKAAILDFATQAAELSRDFGFDVAYRTITNGAGRHSEPAMGPMLEDEVYTNISTTELFPHTKLVVLGTLEQIMERKNGLPAETRIKITRNKPGESLCRNIDQLCKSAPDFEDEDIENLDYLLVKGFMIDNLPMPKYTACQATDPQSFIMDVSGDIYKCWDDIGSPSKKLSGNLDDPMDTQTFRWLSWDPFHEVHCRLCNILPWCLGGCKAGPPDADCSKWHYAIREMLSLTAQACKSGAPK